MKKSILALTAAAMMAAAVPTVAQARCDGCGVAAGVIGGLAAGAIIGNAIAGHPAYAEPAPPPPPSRVYYEDDDAPVCHIERRRVWVEGWGWRHRRVEVCE
ncbi:MAG TPA: hypothetical protein VE224_16280 [Pseudolabrys sp.]|jgi:hypothetical protein|nr:hypothetical protein [Pseudolabrys sp.]